MMGLFTIGYEGVDFADFLTTLRAVGATTLLDVRERPISRRKGFSKSALGEAMRAAGIAYQHERLPGAPRDVRHRLKATGHMKTFLSEYEVHLAQQTGLLDEFVDPVRERRADVLRARCKRLSSAGRRPGVGAHIRD